MNFLKNQNWVWPAGLAAEVNQFVEFRHEFSLDGNIDDAELCIAADTNYVLWLNGEFVGTGQFSDYPDEKTYSEFSVRQHLRVGKNVLAVLVNYLGEGHFSYIPARPGLIYIMHSGDVVIASGTDTNYRKSKCYRSGSAAKITGQMAFTFEYDATADDSWQRLDYHPNDQWKSIIANDIIPQETMPLPQPRPLKKLQILRRTAAEIVAQGAYKRIENDKNKTLAEMMQTDYLSAREANKIFKGVTESPVSLDSGREIISEENTYLLVDIGREECGYLDLEIDATEGAIVDIAWGEHLDDLRVRASTGLRNFASRYICKSGKQRFTHYFTRWAGRYLQLHISKSDNPEKDEAKKNLVLHYAGLMPAEYPVEEKGEFHSPDNLQNKIYEVAVRTLLLCMHEHYEDCPWREQALYANDMRNQALCGYYCFGEYEFPKVSLSLLGRGFNDDGFLELCAPAKIPITIPSFSMVWFLALADHLRFSGDVEFARRWLPQVQKMMNIYIANISDDLLPSPKGKRYWHFYDWADGLNGSYPSTEGQYKLMTNRFDAPLNMLFCLALDAASFLSLACGDDEQAKDYDDCAKRLKHACNQRFWDAKENAYQTYSGTDCREHFAELTQALAICAGVCSDDVAAKLRKKLASARNGLVETTLSQSFYKFEAMMMDAEHYGRWVFDKILRDWSEMLFAGATSFWETLRGGWDFGNAGSLCHGWSAVPVYFYHAHLLGVRPTEIGFKKFTVDPVKDVSKSASGQVPTPSGVIKVNWEQIGDKIVPNLVHPDKMRLEVQK